MLIRDKEMWLDTLAWPSSTLKFTVLTWGISSSCEFGIISHIFLNQFLNFILSFLIYGFKIANLSNEAMQ